MTPAMTPRLFAVGALALTAIAVPGRAETRMPADYVPVLESAKADALPISPETGVFAGEIADGVYVVSDGVWQSAFVVTSDGVIVIDAPASYAPKVRAAIEAATDQPIKTLVYSHAHKDHIGGAAAFGDIEALEIVALEGVHGFLAEKRDPNRPIPTTTFKDQKTIEMGGKRIELRRRNYHSDEGDLLIYIPDAKFLMAIDTLAPGYVPFWGFDLTSNFYEYLKVFDDILAYDFDTFVGGHLTALGTRADVEMTKAYVNDVYETVKRIHAETDMVAVMAATAEAAGGWDNKYLLFKTFLDTVAEDATAEIEGRWIDKLAGVDVWADSHVRTALVYVRWDD